MVGEHSHDNDLVINVTKSKKLTNMRASGSVSYTHLDVYKRQIQAMFKEVAKGIETPCYIRRKFARKGYNMPEKMCIRDRFYPFIYNRLAV